MQGEELQPFLVAVGEVEVEEDAVVVADGDDPVAEQGMVQLVVVARWRAATPGLAAAAAGGEKDASGIRDRSARPPPIWRCS
jgi:hypothetical protein